MPSSRISPPDCTALFSCLCSGIGVSTEFPAAIDEFLQGAAVMENEDGAKILHAKTKTDSGLAHVHVGVPPGAVVLHDTLTTAEAGQYEVDIGVAEHGIAGRSMASPASLVLLAGANSCCKRITAERACR